MANPSFPPDNPSDDRFQDPAIPSYCDGVGDNPMVHQEYPAPIIALERPGTPLSSDEQRATKRVKEKVNSISLVGDDFVMVEASPGSTGVGRGVGVVDPISATTAEKLSYADLFKWVTTGENNDVNGVFQREEIVVNDEDVSLDLSGPYPAINFSEKVDEQIAHNMRRTVIVRMLGCTMGYRALLNHVTSLWKLQGKFHMVDLEGDFFVHV
ncbi:hypothetical protein V6N13_037378 [Hibiscus sabdariffa]|uniref:Uncharacterized protein n=1 Tax=Hibiscus sabdariffa TaxID=183260 RepID=A0ABR2EB68_9ROSI